MNSRNIPRFILILPMMLALLAGSSFWNLAAAQSHETEVFYEVGMKYRFPDGSEGVVCYVDPDNPHRGWAVALEDLKVSNTDKFAMYDENVQRLDNVLGLLTEFDVCAWSRNTDWQRHGAYNTKIMLDSRRSPAANAASTKSGWYIPDIQQLR